MYCYNCKDGLIRFHSRGSQFFFPRYQQDLLEVENLRIIKRESGARVHRDRRALTSIRSFRRKISLFTRFTRGELNTVPSIVSFFEKIPIGF